MRNNQSKKWKLAIVALAGIIVFSSHLSVLARPKDVEGWNKARWGMTEAQIESTFEGRVEKFPQSEKYEAWYVNLWIRSLDIGGNQYELLFQMDEKTRQLKGILISPKGEEGTFLRKFKSLEQLLLGKYGSPSYKENVDHGFGPNFVRSWIFPTTTIRLYYYKSNLSDIALLRLSYRPTKAEDYDNI